MIEVQENSIKKDDDPEIKKGLWKVKVWYIAGDNKRNWMYPIILSGIQNGIVYIDFSTHIKSVNKRSWDDDT
jgi:hypothetical protein